MNTDLSLKRGKVNKDNFLIFDEGAINAVSVTRNMTINVNSAWKQSNKEQMEDYYFNRPRPGIILCSSFKPPLWFVSTLI